MDGRPSTAARQRLNLGCGRDSRAGRVNLDARALQGVDVVHDLAEALPFADGSFTEVLCQDVLEHVDVVPVLRELHRVTVPGALVRVRSPHFSGRLAHLDPTHRHSFSIETLRYFVDSGPGDDYYFDFDFAFTAMVGARILLPDRRGLPWNRAVQRWVNSSGRWQEFYEESALCHLFPAMNVEVTLVR